MDLYSFFDKNFYEGKRYDLIMRLAGSCAVCGVPIEECIAFYRQFVDRDDEDRTKLIKRTYEKVRKGEKVITLAIYGVDVKEYFNIATHSTSIENKPVVDIKIPEEVKYAEIDLNEISIPLTKRFKKEYFYLLGRKITPENIEKYNIRLGIDRLANRIIFPVFNAKGKCIYYVARAVEEGVKPKYLNPVGVSKEYIIWNYYNCDFTKPVFVCEGIINAITVMNYLPNSQAVAVLGKYLTQGQETMLSVFPAIYLCFDGDVEEEYLDEVKERLTLKRKIGNFAEFVYRPVYVIKMPKGKDVNDLRKSEFLNLLETVGLTG